MRLKQFVPELVYVLKILMQAALLMLILWSGLLFFEKPGQQMQPQILNFEEFQHYLSKNNDTVYVINFWATWCAPCVKELPDFEKLNELYHNQNFKMLLVSLDFRKMFESRLIPFIKEKKLKAEVILLHDPDANAWIDKVDPSWSGAIPATLIYTKDYRNFHEGSYTFDQLNKIVKPLMK